MRRVRAGAGDQALGRRTAGQAQVSRQRRWRTNAGPRSAGVAPRLCGSATVQSSDPASVIRVILRGTDSASTAAAPTGPADAALGRRVPVRAPS